MAESDQFFPEYWPANRIIGELEGVLLRAEDIIGELTSNQIKNLAAEKITGQLTSAQIKELEAAKVAGQLTNAQIEAIAAAKITGQLSASQLAAGIVTTEKLAALSVTAGKLAVGSVTAEKLLVTELSAISAHLGVITAGKLIGVEIEDLGALILKEATSEAIPQESAVQWRKSLALAEMIGGKEAGGAHVLELLANYGALGEHGRIEALAVGASATIVGRKSASAKLILDATEDGKLELEHTHKNGTGASAPVVIYDGNGGKSSFLQLATGISPSQRYVNWGFNFVEFVGAGTHLSAGKAVPHGLPTAPTGVQLTAAYGPGYAITMTIDAYAVDATYIYVQGVAGSGGVPGSVNIGFYWEAKT